MSGRNTVGYVEFKNNIYRSTLLEGSYSSDPIMLKNVKREKKREWESILSFISW